MRILALSGSTRTGSTNGALLHAMAARAPAGVQVKLLENLADFPIFSPDLEGELTPPIIEAFAARVRESDGLLVSSPEYVRDIPGGLKNAIDWLVSRDEIMHRPVALVHASHRGDDVLDAPRRVLGTVTSRFDEAGFVRFPLMGPDGVGVASALGEAEHAERISGCFRSERGAALFCRIRGYISTAKQQRRNVMGALSDALAGRAFDPSEGPIAQAT